MVLEPDEKTARSRVSSSEYAVGLLAREMQVRKECGVQMMCRYDINLAKDGCQRGISQMER